MRFCFLQVLRCHEYLGQIRYLKINIFRLLRTPPWNPTHQLNKSNNPAFCEFFPTTRFCSYFFLATWLCLFDSGEFLDWTTTKKWWVKIECKDIYLDWWSNSFLRIIDYWSKLKCAAWRNIFSLKSHLQHRFAEVHDSLRIALPPSQFLKIFSQWRVHTGLVGIL